MADTAPISVYIGDDWAFPVAIQDGSGNPVDLTGYTPGGEFWQSFATTPTEDITVLNGRVTGFNTPSNGQFVLNLEAAVTANVPAQAGSLGTATRIQAFLLDPNGKKTTVGIIIIQPIAPRSV